MRGSGSGGEGRARHAAQPSALATGYAPGGGEPCRSVLDRGHIYLLVGPSGGGKTTLIRRVTSCGDTGFHFVPSTTSRPPRPGECEGMDYYFAADREFDHLIAAGDFLEWQRVHGFRYGSSRSRLEAVVSEGRRGITSADILGAFKIKAAMPADVTTIFVTPSAPDKLRQRILERAPLPAAELSRRLDRVEMEMRLAHACDRLILNDDLEMAVAHLQLIAAAQAGTAARFHHFHHLPVIPMVEVGTPPGVEFGTRFCVADCETAEAAVERVLHQWWWECHPGAVHFDLPPRLCHPSGRRELVRTTTAVCDVSWWSADLPDGRPFSSGLM